MGAGWAQQTLLPQLAQALAQVTAQAPSSMPLMAGGTMPHLGGGMPDVYQYGQQPAMQPQAPARVDPRRMVQQQQMQPQQPGVAGQAPASAWGGVPQPAFADNGQPTWLPPGQQGGSQAESARYRPY
jgi:hypothetical protein